MNYKAVVKTKIEEYTRSNLSFNEAINYLNEQVKNSFVQVTDALVYENDKLVASVKTIR